jgi:hypothetical protein
MTIKVENYGFEKNCPEGQCLELSKIEFITESKGVIFKECKPDEEKPDESLIF